MVPKAVEDFSAFLNMEGHAAFVWPAMGIAAVILTVMAIASIRRLRCSKRALHIAESAVTEHQRRNEKESGK